MKHTNTKQIRYAYHIYKNSQNRNLECVYKNPSRYKRFAFEDCLRICSNLNGNRVRIIGANSMTFSVGFTFIHPKTEKEAFCYITKSNIKFVYLDEIEKAESVTA